MANAEIYPFLKGFLSQWHPSNFSIDGRHFNCAEQYMMWRKAVLFGDDKIAVKIMETNHPSDQKRLGQHVQNFEQAIWDNNKIEIVTTGNRAKFSQNDGLKKKLIKTGDAILVETNPRDIIWGIGLSASDPDVYIQENWRGENLLGNILMGIRAKLRDLQK